MKPNETFGFMDKLKPRPPEPLKSTLSLPKFLTNDMEKPKPASKSLTIWGIIATLLGAVLTLIGVDPELVNFLADGIQWTDITAIVTLIGAVLAYYGRKRANGPLSGVVRRAD